MNLFIGDLPNKTSTQDIEKLLGESGKDALIKFSNRHFSDGSFINFCVVTFSSRVSGERAMKALQNKKVDGEHLKYHEFHFRSYDDNRRLNTSPKLHGNDKRRYADRRREESFVIQSDGISY